MSETTQSPEPEATPDAEWPTPICNPAIHSSLETKRDSRSIEKIIYGFAAQATEQAKVEERQSLLDFFARTGLKKSKAALKRVKRLRKKSTEALTKQRDKLLRTKKRYRGQAHYVVIAEINEIIMDRKHNTNRRAVRTNTTSELFGEFLNTKYSPSELEALAISINPPPPPKI